MMHCVQSLARLAPVQGAAVLVQGLPSLVKALPLSPSPVAEEPRPAPRAGWCVRPPPRTPPGAAAAGPAHTLQRSSFQSEPKGAVPFAPLRRPRRGPSAAGQLPVGGSVTCIPQPVLAGSGQEKG